VQDKRGHPRGRGNPRQPRGAGLADEQFRSGEVTTDFVEQFLARETVAA